MLRVVVCIATELEGRYLPSFPDIDGRSVAIVRTGVGPVNAAMALTRFLSHQEVGLVVSLGVGGAYPGSGLEIGEVVCAESEYYADLGADSPQGFLDMKALGFPVVGEYYNRLPLDRFPTPRRAPFVTRATCSGRIEDARAIGERTGGAVESMEGAAIVHVALAHRLAVAEIRGISNQAGDRERSNWRLDEAAQAACTAFAEWIEEAAC